ncbi:MAG: hypothetical protein KDJ15_08050 [Alphaproteobacteria bacterium]|nr:hypothetical protein [Alphaproteobacteria bacterium]
MASHAFEHALDSLGVLQETGLTIAPRKPTVRMCEIGAAIGGVDLSTAHMIYEAMLEAALAHAFGD